VKKDGGGDKLPGKLEKQIISDIGPRTAGAWRDLGVTYTKGCGGLWGGLDNGPWRARLSMMLKRENLEKDVAIIQRASTQNWQRSSH
jgi:hypothetical protein